MVKLSKDAKARVKMSTVADRKSVKASARKLFEYGLISRKRALAIKKETDK